MARKQEKSSTPDRVPKGGTSSRQSKISVSKLAKSAGIVFTSYDLEKTEESLFLQGLIATEETATWVKSILLEEGYRANGSIEAFQSRRRGKWRR